MIVLLFLLVLVLIAWSAIMTSAILRLERQMLLIEHYVRKFKLTENGKIIEAAKAPWQR